MAMFILVVPLSPSQPISTDYPTFIGLTCDREYFVVILCFMVILDDFVPLGKKAIVERIHPQLKQFLTLVKDFCALHLVLQQY